MTLIVNPVVWDDVVLDKLVVEGIRVTGYHGVLRAERESGQLFLADVVAHVNTRAPAKSDNVNDTANYSTIADIAAEVLAGDPADLIETVAEHIATRVLALETVLAVDVAVHKPQAPLHVEFKDVSVQIHRELNYADLWADRRIGSAAGLSDDPLSPDAIGEAKDEFDVHPEQPVSALLALGGNLGDTAATLARAVEDIMNMPGIEVRSTSPLVKTRPVGGPEQPDYLNAVMRITTTLPPRSLMFVCQGIEMVHGRSRGTLNGPRTLDLDVIAYGTMVATSADMTLPHPRAHERAFVLHPWASMEPDAVLDGGGGGRVADLAMSAADAGGVTLVASPWPPRGEGATGSLPQV